MERYNEYKDSGVQWLGEIPSHWEVKRLASYFIERRTKVSDKDYEPLSVTKNGIFPQLENVAKTNDGDNRKLVLKGDFVINSRSDRKGSSGVSKYDGSVSLINIVLNPRSNVIPDYCNYILKGYSFIEEYYRNGRGIVADLWTTRYDEMKTIKICMPPVIEQQAIVSYLDTATAKIDEAIAQQQKMIDLLNERKQIIINNAVTKGLNPDAPMKDSGVDWIGVIPEHWVVRRMASLGVFSKGGGISRDNLLEEGEPAILYGDIYTKYNYFAEDIKNHVSKKVALASVEVHKNELLMTGSGETKEDIGKTIVFLGNKAYAGGDVIIFKQDNNNSSFLSYALNSSYAKNFRYKESKGEIVVHIYANAVRQLYLALPDITEQNSIVEYLNNKVGIIDSEICVVRKQISLLQERKQIIINDVVTGKVKVS